MKKLLVILSVIIVVSCKNMDHYEIIGTVKNIPDNTIISLFEISDNVGNMIATDTIIDGKFNWSKDSFDGRYFGPLPASTIVGRADPLWIREED